MTGRTPRIRALCFPGLILLGFLVMAASAQAQLLPPILSLGARAWTAGASCANAPGECEGATWDPNGGPHEFFLHRVRWEGTPDSVTIVLHWPESWTVLGWDLCYGVLRSGDPSVNGSTLRLAFPGCPSPAEPFLRIRLDCTQPGKFWVGDGRVRYCGGYAEQEHYGLWVDIGDFCGANHHEGCNPCGYRGLSGTFSPSALQVVLAPGSTYVDTLLVSGSLGPDCGGLPECGGPWYGACFGGLYADQPWMTVTLLDLPEEGYHTMRYRLVVTQPGPSPGEYNGRVYASNGCHCTPNCMPVTVLVGAPGDAPPAEEPSADLLGLPSPNPTAGAVRFAIHLPARMEARVSVFDAGGRLVARVLDGEQPAGTSYHAWAPSDPLLRSIPSGIYFLRVETGGEARSRMIVLGR